MGQCHPLLLCQVRGPLVHFLFSTRGALGRFSARREGDLAPESDGDGQSAPLGPRLPLCGTRVQWSPEIDPSGFESWICPSVAG